MTNSGLVQATLGTFHSFLIWGVSRVGPLSRFLLLALFIHVPYHPFFNLSAPFLNMCIHSELSPTLVFCITPQLSTMHEQVTPWYLWYIYELLCLFFSNQKIPYYVSDA